MITTSLFREYLLLIIKATLIIIRGFISFVGYNSAYNIFVKIDFDYNNRNDNIFKAASFSSMDLLSLAHE